jgi:hypothetical protein
MKKVFLFSILALLTVPSPAQATDLAANYAFGQVTSFGSLISYIVPVATTVAGLMVAFYFLTACFDYINSHGDKNAVSAARQKIEHSIIGLILLLGAFILVRYVPRALNLAGMPSIFSP